MSTERSPKKAIHGRGQHDRGIGGARPPPAASPAVSSPVLPPLTFDIGHFVDALGVMPLHGSSRSRILVAIVEVSSPRISEQAARSMKVGGLVVKSSRE